MVNLSPAHLRLALEARQRSYHIKVVLGPQFMAPQKSFEEYIGPTVVLANQVRARAMCCFRDGLLRMELAGQLRESADVIADQNLFQRLIVAAQGDSFINAVLPLTIQGAFRGRPDLVKPSRWSTTPWRCSG
jgi:hypothetical protein